MNERLHKMIIYVSAIVLVLALFLHAFYPDDVQETVILTILAFLFGKASNGWKRDSDEAR